MMEGNPSWWTMHSKLRSSSASDDDHDQEVAPNLLISQTQPYTSLLPLDKYLHGSSSSSSSSTSLVLPFSSSLAHDHHHGQYFPHSWSQLLLERMASEEEERAGQILHESTRVICSSGADVKQEVTSSSSSPNNNYYLYGYKYHHEEQEAGVSNRPAAWSKAIPASSPKSCVTTLSNNNNNNDNNNNILDFTTSKIFLQDDSHQHAEHSNSECNSTANGGVPNKKPRVQSFSTLPLKVRKEKLGDRITTLHQLVSPFGKTDTASVLIEAIGYIRFLHAQIEALTSPYLRNDNSSAKNNQHSDHKGTQRDLKSRGLCLVPISCTQLVGSDNGADYWTPSLGGGF